MFKVLLLIVICLFGTITCFNEQNNFVRFQNQLKSVNHNINNDESLSSLDDNISFIKGSNRYVTYANNLSESGTLSYYYNVI